MGPVPGSDAVPDWIRNGYVYRQIRRCNRNLLWTNVAIAAVLLLLAVVSTQYYVNFFRGPAPMDRATLQAMKHGEAPWRYYVTVTGDRAADLGLREVETREPRHSVAPPVAKKLPAVGNSPKGNGKSTDKSAEKSAGKDPETSDEKPATDSGSGTEPDPSESQTSSNEREVARYAIVEVGDRYLLVKSDSGEVGATVTGALTSIPSDVSQNLPDDHEFQQRLLPVMLDATDFHTSGIVGMLIGIPLFSLAVWNLRRVRDRFARPETHPIAVILGQRGPFPQVVAAIEYEMAEKQFIYQLGEVILTRSWVFHPQTFGLRAARFDEIVWIYKKVMSTKYYGVVTIRKQHACCVCTRLGMSLEIPSSEVGTDTLLAHTANRAPWAVCGFDKSIEQTWIRNRQAIIGEVDARMAYYRQA